MIVLRYGGYYMAGYLFSLFLIFFGITCNLNAKDPGIRSNLELLTTEEKVATTTAMGTVNAFLGTPFQHVKNALQNKTPIPALYHLWRGTGLNAIRSAPSTLPEVLIMGNANAIIAHAQLPVSHDVQRASLAFGAAIPGTVLNTMAEQVVMQKNRGLTDTSCYAIVKNIIKTAGPSALFRGFSPKLLRDGIGSTSYWYAAPQAKQQCQECGLQTPLATVVGGAITAGASAFITHPFDTISTAMQSDLYKNKYRSTIASFASYSSMHGITGLLRGATPRIASACVRVPALIGTQEYVTNLFISRKNKDHRERN